MKIFKKTGHPQPTKLQKRVATIGTTDLIIWAENALAQIGRNLAGRGTVNEERLYEAEIAADALVAVIAELKKRVHDAR